MSRRIRFVTEGVGEVLAEVLGDVSPKTAEAVWEALPFESDAHRWGDEVYFEIPVSVGEENAKEVVGLGDVAYWPPGRAMCIFFGRTPVSRGSEIRPYSPVNVFAKLLGEPRVFTKVREGDRITVESA